MAASAYYMTSKEVKNQILRHNSILSQPTLTKWWNCICVQILYSYFRYTQKQSSRGVLCILRNFTKSTGKHLCQSLFFNIKKESLAQVFFCEFCEISKNTFFLTEHLWWLLIYIGRLFLLFVARCIRASCSTNKLKPHMLFRCKKKCLFQEMVFRPPSRPVDYFPKKFTFWYIRTNGTYGNIWDIWKHIRTCGKTNLLPIKRVFIWSSLLEKGKEDS